MQSRQDAMAFASMEIRRSRVAFASEGNVTSAHILSQAWKAIAGRPARTCWWPAIFTVLVARCMAVASTSVDRV